MDSPRVCISEILPKVKLVPKIGLLCPKIGSTVNIPVPERLRSMGPVPSNAFPSSILTGNTSKKPVPIVVINKPTLNGVNGTEITYPIIYVQEPKKINLIIKPIIDHKVESEN